MNPRLKRLVLMAVAATCLVVACFYLVNRHYSPVGTYGRIKVGMTLSEVEHVIGAPPGWYAKNPPMPPSMSPEVRNRKEIGLPRSSLRDAGLHDKIILQNWVWDDYCITVALDLHGKVVGCYLAELYGRRGSRGILHLLEDLLGL